MLDKAEYSAFESTLNSASVSYRIVSAAFCNGDISCSCQLLDMSSLAVSTILECDGQTDGRTNIAYILIVLA